MPTNEYKTIQELRYVTKDLDWQLEANCIGVDSELFIPKDDMRGRSVSKHYDQAKQYCFECPVRAECLAFSIYNDMEFGLWGGFTPKQRKGLHKNVSINYYFKKKDSNNDKRKI